MCIRDRREEALPIGKPKAGTEIIFDGEEMLILGDTVAKGYFMEPEKTEKVFFTAEDSKGVVRKAYRTGDSGFYKDGYYYCSGRIDSQVKLHGYRIELGDIESNLMEIPDVEAAAVLPRYDGERIRNLVSFIKAPSLGGTFKDGRASVSYTHLDVYKRQALTGRILRICLKNGLSIPTALLLTP